ncbi:MAG: hypothetical protein WAQ27_05420, partial [Candidatus Microsaccharimonas sp.]
WYSRYMGLYVKQSDTRSQLQEKLAAELQEKARAKAKEAELPDGVNDSAYIEGTRTTSSIAWAWIILIVAIIAAALILIIATASK